MLNGKKILLGVTASIAAYKTAELVRLFKKQGASVKVIQTEASLRFITPLTLSTLSENTVMSRMVDNDSGQWNNHVELGLWADLMLIAPVSAKTLAKMATGKSDNLLLATYLSAKCPVYFAPAMDLDMYKHPSTCENIKKLQEFKNHLIPAEFGELASGLVGEGRMAQPSNIIKYIIDDLSKKLPLKNKNILITAGPTHEAIDPVRYIANKSSGKMGIALAIECANNGANINLVLGPTHLDCKHSNINITRVESANEMYSAVNTRFDSSDISIFAAAVADYIPENVAKNKIKKSNKNLTISLNRSTDILAEMTKKKRSNQIVVGFALETENEIKNAKIKLKKKNLDFIVLNSLNDNGAAFKHDTNKIKIIDYKNNISNFELKDKSEVAKDIISKIIQLS